MTKFKTFQGNVQHDTGGDAHLSVLECAPGLADKYYLLLKVTRKCIECETVNETQELNGVIDLNYINYDTQIRTLLEVVEEYCQGHSNVMTMCAYKSAHFENVRGIKGDVVPVYNTNHEEIWEVVKCKNPNNPTQ